MEVKFIKGCHYAFLPIVFIFLVACSKENDCFIADSIYEMKVIESNGTRYFLYLRTAGLNEKESFYELYKNKPVFDDCGKSELNPMSEVHIDSTQGMVDKLIIEKGKLKLVYSGNESDADPVNLNNIPIDVE